MWPWRKRSPIDKPGLPKKVFISHSYKSHSYKDGEAWSPRSRVVAFVTLDRSAL